MKIIFIGSGNVASHMAVAMKAAGNDIQQIYSRTFNNANLLATKVGAQPVDDLENICPSADLYIFSVKDDALPEIMDQMPPTDGVWAHTAGSIPISVLSSHKECGVLYPLQTFSRDREIHFRDIPLFIEGSSDKTLALLKGVAESISGEVHLLSGDKRCILHLAAVFACNFANHMYTLASEVVEKEEIPFHLLNALITETAAKATVIHPKAAQTGPAVRFDEKVMQKHLMLLDDPRKKEIYSFLSKSIYESLG